MDELPWHRSLWPSTSGADKLQPDDSAFKWLCASQSGVFVPPQLSHAKSFFPFQKIRKDEH